MAERKVFVAVDLGASGGRVLAGGFDGRRVALEEIHRFDNGPVVAAERMHWDLLLLWSQVKQGLRAVADRFGDGVASVGVDTWGVDFGLLGRGDHLLGNPFHYRDSRTDGVMERAFEIVPREEIFAETGIQFMQFNTLYQLLAMKEEDSPLLEVAESFLMMPDILHWLMTGEKVNEFTNATTTQCYNPTARAWGLGILERLGIPTRMFGPIEAPGAPVGNLRKQLADETGLCGARVVLPGTHDTASAVMAVPAHHKPQFGKPDWCYISSGTWSLMGVETERPIITEQSSALNFTNEGGVGGTIRLLKNIAGLWLVQECRRVWGQTGTRLDWDELVDLARAATPLISLINPDDPVFVAPREMPDAIRQYCQRTGQTPPNSHGSVIRCALESIALRYRAVLESLESLVGARLETIHIVGGGAQNQLLCQLAADACRRRVLAGPVEATALGNVMMQAVAAGDVGSIGEARQVIRDSFDLQIYQPQEPDPWDEAYARFQALP